MTEQAPKKKGSAWPIYLVLAAVASVFAFGIYSSTEAKRAGKAYIELVQSGELDAAYAMLSTDKREEVSREQFDSAMGNPLLQDARKPAWNRTSSGSNGTACLVGRVSIDGTSWGIRLYLRKEEGSYRTHELLMSDGTFPNGPWLCTTR